MGSSFAGGKLDFGMNLGKPAAARRLEPDEPFRIAILGDLSGRANRVVLEPVAGRRFRRVDIDSFGEVLASLGAALKIPLENEVVDLSFASIDDFHPDQVVRHVAPLKRLLDLRGKALGGTPIAELAQELRTVAPAPAAAEDSTVTSESSEQTLARLLGGPPTRTAQPRSTGTAAAVEQILRQAVAGSAVPGHTTERQAAVAAVDLELSNYLRTILHHPGFQALEVAWRGLDLLMRDFGGEENIQLWLADVGQHELAADAAATEAPESSGILKLLRSRTETDPLALCLGLYEFGGQSTDLHLLSILANVCAAFSLPLLAQASPTVLGCDSFGTQPDPDDWKRPLSPEFVERWSELRRSPQAAYVSLGAPRFLLRQPYGAQSDPIDSFPFEEMLPTPAHEDYLWANPAIACGYVVARLFQEESWNMRVEGWGELDGLPVHKFVSEGEIQVKPCAEAWLTDRGAEVLQTQGLVPLRSIKGRDAVRVGPLQSIHEPGVALRCHW